MVAAAVCTVAFATIAAALAFEVWGGYAPCPLCLQQRYAYYFAVPAAALAFAATRLEWIGIARLLLGAIALAFVANAALGIYHAGVEWHWWAGPDTCAPATQLAADPSGLLGALNETRVIRCDEAPWQFLGLSFAGWNVLASGLLAGLSAYGFAQDR
jgi:disulfide bond formation protein DsbB